MSETYFADKEGVLRFAQAGPFASVEEVRAQIDSSLK